MSTPQAALRALTDTEPSTPAEQQSAHSTDTAPSRAATPPSPAPHTAPHSPGDSGNGTASAQLPAFPLLFSAKELRAGLKAACAHMASDTRSWFQCAFAELSHDPASQAVLLEITGDHPAQKDPAVRRKRLMLSSSSEALAGLQAEADALVAAGEHYAAFAVQCCIAMSALRCKGPGHAFTLQAVHAVASYLFQRGHSKSLHTYHAWLLPRVVLRWGIAHPDTKKLVQQAALHLLTASDPRPFAAYTAAVAEVAQQLQGGLGWGVTRVVTGMGDEGYNRHVVMWHTALDVIEQGHHKLGQDMLQRCVAYFDSLGPHWLAAPRKWACSISQADCIASLEGPQAAQRFMLAAKQHARRELGATHPTTLEVTWVCALMLYASQRPEAAVSMIQAAAALHKEVYGPCHHMVFQSEVSVWPQTIHA